MKRVFVGTVSAHVGHGKSNLLAASLVRRAYGRKLGLVRFLQGFCQRFVKLTIL